MLLLVIVYSNSTQDVVNPLLYQGFIEETVELLELDQPQFSVSLLIQLLCTLYMNLALANQFCSFISKEEYVQTNLLVCMHGCSLFGSKLVVT